MDGGFVADDCNVLRSLRFSQRVIGLFLVTTVAMVVQSVSSVFCERLWNYILIVLMV